jgi:KUP system potassium uptake protein
MTSQADGVPHALLHNLKHNKVLHERSIFLKVAIEDVPYIEDERRFEVEELGEGFYKIILHFGFLQDMNVPEALARIDRCGFPFKMMETSFFLSRQTPLASNVHGMAIWREKLFAWMMRNAESPMEFFGLPPNRVVEMGSQVKI